MVALERLMSNPTPANEYKLTSNPCRNPSVHATSASESNLPEKLKAVTIHRLALSRDSAVTRITDLVRIVVWHFRICNMLIDEFKDNEARS